MLLSLPDWQEEADESEYMTALIGHDFKPGFWLSFAALLPERAAI